MSDANNGKGVGNEGAEGHDRNADPNHKRFQIKSWTAVGVCTVGVGANGVCTICRNHLQELCNNCQALGIQNSQACGIAWGICNHAFHTHCINRWLLTRQVCPLDNLPWNYRH